MLPGVRVFGGEQAAALGRGNHEDSHPAKFQPLEILLRRMAIVGRDDEEAIVTQDALGATDPDRGAFGEDSLEPALQAEMIDADEL